MNTVVHTETSGEDDVDTGDDINGDIPEVESSNNIHKSEHDTGHHKNAQIKVAQHYQWNHTYSQSGSKGSFPSTTLYNTLLTPWSHM